MISSGYTMPRQPLTADSSQQATSPDYDGIPTASPAACNLQTVEHFPIRLVATSAAMNLRQLAAS